MEVEIPIRKFIKRRLFFPFQTEPKCNTNQAFSPITNLLIFIFVICFLSILIHFSIYYFWKKDITDFHVTTFCTKYLGQLIDENYVFNGIPFSVSPSLLKLSVKDILGRQLSKSSLRWLESIELKSIETCFASHSNQCIFNNSVWRCTKNLPRKRCISFIGEQSSETTTNKTSFSEDCLYLTIRIPKRRPKNIPVVVFFSGVYYANDISSKIGRNYPFEPSGDFVNEVDAIFVTLSYRWGPFGTFYNHNLTLENFSMSDLLVGLEWIQTNIEKFGGDKNKITLLAHGSGATLGLSVLLQKSHLFRSAWLSSGSVHIPNDNGIYDIMLQDLFVSYKEKCASEEFYLKHCKNKIMELMLLSSKDIVRLLSKYYQPENSLSSLLETTSMLQRTRTQNPFIIIDLLNIIDSPLNMIYKNVLPSIPIVFTSMLSEFHGFPGERQWNLKSAGKIEYEITNLFDYIFLLSKVGNPPELRNRIWAKIKTTGQKKKKSLGQIVMELFSFLRVTCPQIFVANQMRKLQKNTILNLIHTESPSQPMKGMLFEEVAKRFPFYGFDILSLFKKDKLFNQNPSSKSQLYQNNLIKYFKNFVHYGKIIEISKSNVTDKKLIEINNAGIRQFPESEYLDLCNSLDYKILKDFVNKIN